MIALLLAAQTVPAPDALPQPLGRQSLPPRGCAAFLWNRGPQPQLIAAAIADPATLRLALGGPAAEYPRVAMNGGEAGFGFAAHAEYRRGSVTAILDLVIAPRPDLTQGAAVSDATLTIRREGADEVVLPVGGLVGCAPAS